MRYDGGSITRQVNSDFQTHGENANPAAIVKVTRHKIPISYWDFVERSLITTESGITDISVATKHVVYDRGEQEVWVAYVQNGRLKVKSSRVAEDIAGFEWIEESIDYPASACAIAFNSVVHRVAGGKQEFLTEEYPWVFWVQNGALKAWQIYSNSLPVELAAENVTDISAVRGPSAEWGSWDLGLTAFFIMNGALFYRQYINEEWHDAELMTSGPSGTYMKIAAYRTWDYRVCVQALMNNNKLYNIFTYTEGIGVRGAEHIEMSMEASIDLTGIEYHTFFNNEHIGVDMSSVVKNLWAWSVIPQSARNIEDQNEDWGTTIRVTFDYPVHADNLSASAFLLTDTGGNNYNCTGYHISGEENLVLTLTFDDFNLAGLFNGVSIKYTKPSTGGLMSPAVQTDSFSFDFVPTNLNPPQINAPEFDFAFNDASGMIITITFTEDLLNDDVSGLISNFSIGLREYSYVPNGSLENTTRTIANIVKSGTKSLIMTINKPNFSSAIGDIIINYDGLGGLRGYGGPVQAFSEGFTPSGLTWKGHQNDEEHIEVTLTSNVIITGIEYHNAKHPDEHIEINMSASITLTDIHDL